MREFPSRQSLTGDELSLLFERWRHLWQARTKDRANWRARSLETLLSMYNARCASPISFESKTDYKRLRVPSLKDLAIVHTLISTAVRSAELRCLRWDCIRPDGTICIEHGAKGNKIRVIVADPDTVKVLRVYRRSLVRRPKPTDLVFPSRQGGAITHSRLNQIVHATLQACGLDKSACGKSPGTSAHALRRASLTSLARQGVPISVLMHQAGHEHESTTSRYLRMAAEEARTVRRQYRAFC